MTPTGAVVLASGPGTRLGDLGTKVPKTMLPVGGRPYLAALRHPQGPTAVGINPRRQVRVT